MTPYAQNINKTMFNRIQKAVSVIIVVAFVSTSIQNPVYAQLVDPMPHMSVPGTMVPLSPEFTPAYLKGIVIHPENALKFDFIVYKGDQFLTDAQKRVEYTKLTKYFLASLAIPDDDQWVNLSPYEKDRIIKDDFGKTEMGRDLLAQDYMLKQITASLIYPEGNLGKKFWDRIYTQARQEFGTSDIPVNTFNKVWILPDDALIYEKGNTAYVLKNHLRVMLEEDYLSLKKHEGIQSAPINKTHTIASRIVREIVLPELEREVNEDRNFAAVRQVYSGMLLATWYKRALKESLLSRIYSNKAKVKGVDADPRSNEMIYHQYLRAYKRGVFNYIKEDVDKYTNEMIPRKYFSGGMGDYEASKAMFHTDVVHTEDRLSAAQSAVALTDFNSNRLDDFALVAAEEKEATALEQNNRPSPAMKTIDQVRLLGRWTIPAGGKIDIKTWPVKYDRSNRKRQVTGLDMYLIKNPQSGYVVRIQKGFSENGSLFISEVTIAVGKNRMIAQIIFSNFVAQSKVFLTKANFDRLKLLAKAISFAKKIGSPAVTEVGKTVGILPDLEWRLKRIYLNNNNTASRPLNEFSSILVADSNHRIIDQIYPHEQGYLSLQRGIISVDQGRSIETPTLKAQYSIEQGGLVIKTLDPRNEVELVVDPNNAMITSLEPTVTFVDINQDPRLAPNTYLTDDVTPILSKMEQRIRARNNELIGTRALRKTGAIIKSIGIELNSAIPERFFTADQRQHILSQLIDAGFVGPIGSTSAYYRLLVRPQAVQGWMYENRHRLGNTSSSFRTVLTTLSAPFDRVSFSKFEDSETGSYTLKISRPSETNSVLVLLQDMQQQITTIENPQAAAVSNAMSSQDVIDRVNANKLIPEFVYVPSEVPPTELVAMETQARQDTQTAFRSRASRRLPANEAAEIVKAVTIRIAYRRWDAAKNRAQFLVQYTVNAAMSSFDQGKESLRMIVRADPVLLGNNSSALDTLQDHDWDTLINLVLQARTNAGVKYGNGSSTTYRALTAVYEDLSSAKRELDRTSSKNVLIEKGSPARNVEEPLYDLNLDLGGLGGFGLEAWDRMMERMVSEPVDKVRLDDQFESGVTLNIGLEERGTSLIDRLRTLRQWASRALGVTLVFALTGPAIIQNRVNVNRLTLHANNPALTNGGIDFNSANLNLQIKRDGRGVPLPISQQDLENIHIDGLIPVILSIKPAVETPLMAELQISPA